LRRDTVVHCLQIARVSFQQTVDIEQVVPAAAFIAATHARRGDRAAKKLSDEG
jgi:hypothetical protein